MKKGIGPQGLGAPKSPLKQTAGCTSVEEMKANARTIVQRNAERASQERAAARTKKEADYKAKIKQNDAIGFDDGSQGWKNKKKAYEKSVVSERVGKFADEIKGRSSKPS